MASYNKTILVGNLTGDVKVIDTKGKTALAKFSMAVNEKYKEEEHVLYMDVTVFGSLADIAEKYLKKGSPVLVEGKLRTETWDDKKNPGEKRSKNVLIASDIRLLGNGGGKGKTPDDNDGANNGGSGDGNVPF